MSSVPQTQSDSEEDDDYIPPTREGEYFNPIRFDWLLRTRSLELNSNSEDESQLETQQVKGEVETTQEAEDRQK